jgi:CRP/FNR family transcriptional regulator, nitrogen oxide reductase regulator
MHEQIPSLGTQPAPRLSTSTLAECATRSRVTLVHSFPLFADIPIEACREIVAQAQTKEFLRRETIYQEGDSIRRTILLISGCVKITQLGENGSEVILRLNGSGDVIGKIDIQKHARHCSKAQTLRASTVLIWDASVFEALSVRYPALRKNTMRSLSSQLEELEQRFREISTEKVASRLSREIVRLLAQVGRVVNGTVEIALSREELAQLTGTTLFTVSRLLSDWDQRGIVSTRREAVSVNDLVALQQLAERD